MLVSLQINAGLFVILVLFVSNHAELLIHHDGELPNLLFRGQQGLSQVVQQGRVIVRVAVASVADTATARRIDIYRWKNSRRFDHNPVDHGEGRALG